MHDDTITVDVRPEFRGGGDPFSKIMGAVAGLQTGQRLMVIAPFEPVPLFAVMGRHGFDYTARQSADGAWEVLFEPRAATATASPVSPVPSRGTESLAKSEQWILDVDARGLEPPQPLVRILETLNTLPSDAALRARTDRRPMHLYSELESRGFVGTTEEESDGSFVTHIRRR